MLPLPKSLTLKCFYLKPKSYFFFAEYKPIFYLKYRWRPYWIITGHYVYLWKDLFHIATTVFLDHEDTVRHRNHNSMLCIRCGTAIWAIAGGHIEKLAVILVAILFNGQEMDYMLLLDLENLSLGTEIVALRCVQEEKSFVTILENGCHLVFWWCLNFLKVANGYRHDVHQFWWNHEMCIFLLTRTTTWRPTTSNIGIGLTIVYI